MSSPTTNGRTAIAAITRPTSDSLTSRKARTGASQAEETSPVPVNQASQHPAGTSAAAPSRWSFTITAEIVTIALTRTAVTTSKRWTRKPIHAAVSIRPPSRARSRGPGCSTGSP